MLLIHINDAFGVLCPQIPAAIIKIMYNFEKVHMQIVKVLDLTRPRDLICVLLLAAMPC